MVILLSGRTIFLLINLVCYLICNFEISKGGCVFAGSVCFVLSIGGCFVCGEYVIKSLKINFVSLLYLLLFFTFLLYNLCKS